MSCNESKVDATRGCGDSATKRIAGLSRGARNAPIGSKKSIRTSPGDAHFFVFASSGASIPRLALYLHGRFVRTLCLATPGESKDSFESVHATMLACFAWVRLGSPGEAESGSAGVQPDEEYPGRRCADGASAWWVRPARLFFPAIGHRSPCLKNPPRSNQQRDPVSTIAVL